MLVVLRGFTAVLWRWCQPDDGARGKVRSHWEQQESCVTFKNTCWMLPQVNRFTGDRWSSAECQSAQSSTSKDGWGSPLCIKKTQLQKAYYHGGLETFCRCCRLLCLYKLFRIAIMLVFEIFQSGPGWTEQMVTDLFIEQNAKDRLFSSSKLWGFAVVFLWFKFWAVNRTKKAIQRHCRGVWEAVISCLQSINNTLKTIWRVLLQCVCSFNYKGNKQLFGVRAFHQAYTIFCLLITRNCHAAVLPPPVQGSASQPVMHHQNRFRLGSYCPGLLRQRVGTTLRA